MEYIKQISIYQKQIRFIRGRLLFIDSILCAGYIFWWVCGMHMLGINSRSIYIALLLACYGILFLFEGLGISAWIRLTSDGITKHALTYPSGITILCIYVPIAIGSIYNQSYTLLMALSPSLLIGTITGLLWIKALGVDINKISEIHNRLLVKAQWKILKYKDYTKKIKDKQHGNSISHKA